MKVCLISNQIAAWGKIGGFGTATRSLGAGLVRRGIEVCAVVLRQTANGQGEIEDLDGIKVYGMSPLSTLTDGTIFREVGADIYHSQEPTLPTRFAQRAVPNAVHVVTCRDPRGVSDHLTELRFTNAKRRLRFPVTWLYEASPWVKSSVRHADGVICPAPSIGERARKLYGSDIDPRFIPSSTELPDGGLEKFSEPLAIFVGRWDHRKRIERFFELASRSPQVRFVAIGRAHDEAYDRHLRKRYGGLSNVELPGFIPRFGEGGLYEYYERAWIIVNTSAREGLPYTFIEAAGWGCAILSCLDPDDFAGRFGKFVEDDDFESGLAWLLADERWRTLGNEGRKYVGATFSEQNSIDQHLSYYEHLLAHERKPR